MKKIKGMHVILLLLIISFISLGCQGEERPDPQPQDNTEKIPPALTEMDESIHSIIEDIQGITEVLEIKPEDIKPQKEQQEEAPESSGGEGGQEEAQGEQEQPASAPPPQPTLEEEMENLQREKQAQVLEKWQSAKESLISLHESWNKYEPAALKKGADTGKIEAMERALSQITISLDEQDMNKVLMDSNDVILTISDFLDLYKGNIHGVLGKIEYRIRQSYMDARNGNWLTSRQEMGQTDALVTSLQSRTDIDEEQQPLMDGLIHSIEDVKGVISEENLALLEVKRDIALSNMENLKEELN